MTYEEMRAAQFEICRAWLQGFADQGLWINEAARRADVDKSTIARMAKTYGVTFADAPKRVRQPRKSQTKPRQVRPPKPKPPKKPTKAALRKMGANLKTQLSHHTKRLLSAGYKPEAAKMEAFRMVRANIEQGVRV